MTGVAPSGRKGATVTSGWRVEVALIERIRARAGARGMSQSGWLEEAALAHLERDPLMAEELARALRRVLSGNAWMEADSLAQAHAVLDRYEAVKRV